MAKNTTIIGAGLAGLAVGATLAILFSPRSGEGNRAFMKYEAKRGLVRAKEMKEVTLPRVQQQAKEKVEMVRGKVSTMMHHDGQAHASAS
jgi:gas vesicle protein